FPDKDLAREGWLNIVKPVEKVGRLDHIPARKPVTKKDYETARIQNYWLTKNSFGSTSERYRENYERIKWNRTRTRTEPIANDGEHEH
ncbi:MAG: hypothetical protein KGL95_15715, partial [Patescibacteria group bacterium]|nr:hypothetical protein [Patescibacteria group bacterium]